MAQLVIATAGAVVGGYFGGPVGASVGWSIGSAAGAYLFTEDQVNEQPIADNLSVSVASYGAPIPIRFGTWKGGGVIFWHPEKFRPVRTETTSGGKGGPTVTNVSYTYDIDVAVAVNDGEIGGVSRIWLDGKPVFDQRDSASLSTLIASQEWCETVAVYLGDELQLPDPTMEAALGVDQVPAYRGTAYVVIRGLKCGSSPRLPNLEFEVCTETSPPPHLVATCELPGDGNLFTGTPYNQKARTIRVQGDVLYVNQGDGGSNLRYPIASLDVGAASVPSVPNSETEENWPAAGPLYAPGLGGDEDTGLLKNMSLLQYHPDYGALYFRGQLQSSNPLYPPVEQYPSLRAGSYASGVLGAGWTVPGPDEPAVVEWINNIASPDSSAESPTGAAGCADRQYFMAIYPSGWTLWKIDGAPKYTEYRSGTFDSSGGPTVAYGIGPSGWDGVSRESHTRAAIVESDLIHYWVIYSARVADGQAADGVAVECWEIDESDVMRQLFSEIYSVNDTSSAKAIYADQGFCWVYNSRGEDNSTDVLHVVSRLPLYSTAGVGLDEVVSAIYERTGNDPASDIDVTGLASKTVRGFELAGPSPARQAIEVLRSAYFFDAVESGGKLKFVVRGAASAATIPVEEVATVQATDGAPVPADRRHETEIPAKVVVDYVSHDGDYRRGSQQAQRVTTGSDEVLALALPIVLTDDEAAQIADVILRDAWRGRTTRRFAVGRKWAKLEPTDVVDVEDDQFTYRVRLDADRRDGALIVFDAVNEGGASYSSSATGGAVPPPPTLTLPSSARLAVLDVPPLRDADDGGYQYLAAAPYSGSTLSVEAFKSRDGGSTWQSLAPIGTAATLGSTTTALGSGQVHVVDEANTVQVQIVGPGTLASVSYEQMLEGAQYAAIGAPGRWEIVGFADVTDDGGGLYTIGRLLRGRLGTEDAVGSHAIGDWFVLLDEATLARVPVSAVERDTTALYAAPPIGRSIGSMPKYTVPIEVRSLKPLSPAHFTATRLASGDIVFRWVRRARVNADWRALVDVPLDEGSELYDLEILSETSGAVVRTLTTTSTEITYTESSRAIDTADASPVVNGIVYQRSADVGRGVPATLAAAGASIYSRDWNSSWMLENQSLTSSSGTPAQSIVSSKLRLNVATGGDRSMMCWMDWIQSFKDGVVELDMTVPSSIYRVWLAVRNTYASAYDRGQAGYVFRLENSGPAWVLEKGTNSSSNSATTLASGTMAALGAGAGSTETVRMELNGESVAVYWGGVLLARVSDSTHAAAGRIAIGVTAASAAANFDFDNLYVRGY